MIDRKVKRAAKIGIFAVGHHVYWKQFEGLLDSLMRYHRTAVAMVNENEVELIDYGMIDSSEKAYQISQKMSGDHLDLIFCNMVTYATSSVFAPIIRNCTVPVVLLALQPLKALDYDKASTYMQLENDCIC